jgi:hypothetical protein
MQFISRVAVCCPYQPIPPTTRPLSPHTMDQKSAPSQPHAPFQTGGTGFNEVPPNTQPFHDVNTAADLGKTQAGTLEDFAQPHVGDVYVDQDASAPRASASDTITGTICHWVSAMYLH